MRILFLACASPFLLHSLEAQRQRKSCYLCEDLNTIYTYIRDLYVVCLIDLTTFINELPNRKLGHPCSSMPPYNIRSAEYLQV
ncbi:hypothetical protein F5B17DRAFT_390517 [Nemania serpens]|nr:hypothetical protein F5B17DRAFT_390517 [Nemania serpens]